MSKLYLISQDVNDDYDTYDSAVVVAENEERAKEIHPNSDDADDEGNFSDFHTWAKNISQVKVKYIGEASKDLEAGSVVIYSFNAG